MSGEHGVRFFQHQPRKTSPPLSSPPSERQVLEEEKLATPTASLARGMKTGRSATSSFRGQGKENPTRHFWRDFHDYIQRVLRVPFLRIFPELYPLGLGGEGAWKSIHVTRLVGTAVFPSKLTVGLPLLVPHYYDIPDMNTTQNATRQTD